MILALSLLLSSWFLEPIPEDRNVLQDEVFACCKMHDKEACPDMRKNAYEAQCINKREYEKATQDNLVVLCAGQRYAGACRCGCFDPSTRIRVWDTHVHGWKDETLAVIDEDLDRYLVLAQSLDEEGNQITMEKAKFSLEHCSGKPLLVFYLSNGEVLKVTPEHPMWLSDKRMLPAKELKEDDLLIAENNEKVKIISITDASEPTEVMNIRIHGKSNHLFLANGIWAGGAEEQDALNLQDH